MNIYKKYHNNYSNISFKKLAREIYKKLYILRPIQDKVIFELPENALLLDVGCGPGNFLQKVIYFRNDIKLFACDIIDVISPELKPLINFNIVDLNNDKLPYNDSMFDLIVCIHVIEHLENPLILMRELYRILKNGGKLIVETPSIRSIFIPSILPNWFVDNATLNFYDDPTHIRPYSRKSLLRMARMSDFNRIKVKKSRNILSIISFGLVIFDIFQKRSATLAGFIGSIFGSVNLLIAYKENK